MTDISEKTLQDVIENLATLDRTPCSPGEREAAEWIAARLKEEGCEVVVDTEPSWGPFPPTVVGIGALGVWGAWRVLRRKRNGLTFSLLAGAALLDEAQNGPRIVRRIVRKRKETSNVVATVGEGDRTLVVLGHHDAAQTGKIFDQTWAKWLHRRAPEVLEGPKNQLPQWWLGLAPAPLAALAVVTRSRRLARLALVLAGVGLTAVADIARNPTVPGANDNLSGVAALVALAESLRAEPIEGLKVMLVSCGAEETLQDGIRAFIDRYGEDLAPDKTWFLNLDTVGSTGLVMLEGEGPAWMEDYSDPAFRDLVAESAADVGVSLERGIRARASTDSIIPSRAGFPTATLVSVMPWRIPGNYHLMSDVPEHIDYSTVADATRIARRVGEELAGV
jgi:Peptidase family M28